MSSHNFIDLTGQKFGKLTPIKYIGKNKWGISLWLCKCDCGNSHIVTTSHLNGNSVRSCGCLKKINKQYKNGKESRNHYIWRGIVQRCTNKNSKDYKNYGERGVTVCDRWNHKRGGCFKNFLEDMGEPPTHKHQIDRINNDDGYYKENCRWVLPKENNRNRRNNHLIPFNGEKLCLTEMAEKYGINRVTLRDRLNRGWSIQKALLTPVRKIKRK